MDEHNNAQETLRPKFLSELLMEVDGFDEQIFPCTEALLQGDVAIGPLDPWLRKVYSLGRSYTRDFRQLEVDMEFESGHDEAKCTKVKFLRSKVDLLQNIMWHGAKEQYGLFHDSSIGLRKDWTVVRSAAGPSKVFKLLGLE